MQGKVKLVDNYEFKENQVTIQDGIQVYAARNVILRQMFTLKKFNAKENKNKSTYQHLTNEVGILKALKHPNIVQCHKMLTTSNNFYLVYDFCSGQTLKSLMKTMESNAKQMKLKILKQLVSILQALSEKRIVHTNINPQCIYVTEEGELKMCNFMFAHALADKKTMQVKYKSDFSAYTPPEIERIGAIYPNSDIYSLGEILQEMKIFQISIESSKSQMLSLIKKMMSSDQTERPTIQEIRMVFFPSETVKSKSRPKDTNGYLQKELSIAGNTKSISENSSKERSSLRQHNISVTSEIGNGFKSFIQSILKKRNLSIYLVELVELCFKGPQHHKNLNIALGFFLLVKSTKILQNLHGFLMGEKKYQRQIQIALSDRERKVYEKNSDFFVIITTIGKEANQQKKILQDSKRNISRELNIWLKEEGVSQTIDNLFMKKYVLKYLEWVTESENLKTCDRKLKNRIYLMSQINQFDSFEEMFNKLINEEKIMLEDQALYSLIDRMSEEELLKEIKFMKKK